MSQLQVLWCQSTRSKALQLIPVSPVLGTCTLAIVMIGDVPNPDLLPGGKKKGPPSDTSSYRDLWKIADNLIEQCVMRRGQMGWEVTGMS